MKRNILVAVLMIGLNILGCATTRMPPVSGLPFLSERIVVLVELMNYDKTIGYASGFYVTTMDGMYFVTAKHVLFSPESKKLIGNRTRLIAYELFSMHEGHIAVSRESKEQVIFDLDLASLDSNNYLLYNDSRDVVAIKIGKVVKNDKIKFKSLEILTGINATGWRTNSSWSSTTPEMFKYYQDVDLSSEIFVLGYPRSIGIQNIPQIDFTSPLFRRGIVAGKNEKLKTIIIDCPIYPGNSGGPVIEFSYVDGVTSFKIIGIVTQFVPFLQSTIDTQGKIKENEYGLANSGYGVVVPMDSVMELINSGK